MKSLNRTLSLVLVLVMVLGLFGVANAAFTDDAKIQYKEAVEVMTGIGAINGMGDGTFAPQGDITRAQAAKMVAYTVLGADVASKLGISTSSFKDVTAAGGFGWAIPSIEYLVGVSSINGRGDGTFDPNGKVTGYELAKMLLVAIGYGKNGEFTGNSWKISVAVLANKLVFTNSKAASYDTSATREEAALYCFNILDAVKVVWSKDKETYEFAAGSPTIHNTVYTKLSKNTTPVNGVAGYIWEYKSTPISAFIPTETVLGTITDGTTITAASTPTNSKYIAALSTDTDPAVAGNQPVTYFFNGGAVAEFSTSGTYNIGNMVVHENKLYVANQSHTSAAWDGTHFTEYSVKGAIVTLFAGKDTNAKKIVSVSVVEKAVVQLSAAPSTSTSGIVTYVTIPGVTSNQPSTKIVYPAGLAKGDVVLYYTAADGTIYVDKAAMVSGTISSFIANINVTINGTQYACSGLAGQPGTYDTIVKLQALLGKAGFTFYLDDGNNICYTVAPDASAILTNTVFVMGVQGSESFSSFTAQAIIAKPDGKQETVTVAKVNNGAEGMLPVDSVSKDVTTTPGQLGAKTFYTYTINANGSYSLTKAANQTICATDLSQGVSDTVLDSGDISYTITARRANFLTKVTATGSNWNNPTPTLQTNLAHAGTVFMYYDSTAKAFTTYTGINNALSYAAGGTIYVLNDSTNSFASIVIAMNATTSSAATSYDNAFITSGASVSVDANGTLTYTYQAVLNGEAGKTITSYSPLNIGTLYFVKEYAANGIVMADTAIASASIGNTVAENHSSVSGVSYAGGTMIVTSGASAAYILNANAKIFLLDTTKQPLPTTTQITAEQAAAITYSSDSLVVVHTSATDTSIAAIYITIS